MATGGEGRRRSWYTGSLRHALLEHSSSLDSLSTICTCFHLPGGDTLDQYASQQHDMSFVRHHNTP